jgi:HD-GYP domain-containing protein (c-di-GMP phosphodiesterase class II)
LQQSIVSRTQSRNDGIELIRRLAVANESLKENAQTAQQTQRALAEAQGGLRDGVQTGALEIAMADRLLAEKLAVHSLAEEDLGLAVERLHNVVEQTLAAMSMIVEVREPQNLGHQRRVADLACATAKELSLSQEQTRTVRLAGIIHDVGKVTIPLAILTKPSWLSTSEFSSVRAHCKAGFDIIKSIEFARPIANIVLQHHERLNGSGYPAGLIGEEILLEARILAVADVVEAMTAKRPQREAMEANRALEEILRNKGRLYDPDVAEACLRVFERQGYRFF